MTSLYAQLFFSRLKAGAHPSFRPTTEHSLTPTLNCTRSYHVTRTGLLAGTGVKKTYRLYMTLYRMYSNSYSSVGILLSSVGASRASVGLSNQRTS